MVFVLKDICADGIFIFYVSSYENTIGCHLIKNIPNSFHVSETM